MFSFFILSLVLFSSCLNDSSCNLSNKVYIEIKDEVKWKININNLEDQLGYKFKNREALLTTLYNLENRIDSWVGDSILYFAVSDSLKRKFPNLSVSQLHLLRTKYIANSYLKKIVKEKLKISNPNNESSNGNFLEALISAIRDDSDLETSINILSSLLDLDTKEVDEEGWPYKNWSLKFIDINNEEFKGIGELEAYVISQVKNTIPKYDYIFDIYINEVKTFRGNRNSPCFCEWQEFLGYKFGYCIKVEERDQGLLKKISEMFYSLFFKQKESNIRIEFVQCTKKEEGIEILRKQFTTFKEHPTALYDSEERMIDYFDRILELQKKINSSPNCDSNFIAKLQEESNRNKYINHFKKYHAGIQPFIRVITPGECGKGTYIFKQDSSATCSVMAYHGYNHFDYYDCSGCYKCHEKCIKELFAHFSKIFSSSFHYLNHALKNNFKMLQTYLMLRYNLGFEVRHITNKFEEELFACIYCKPTYNHIDFNSFHRVDGITLFEKENSYCSNFFNRVIKYQKMLEDFHLSLFKLSLVKKIEEKSICKEVIQKAKQIILEEAIEIEEKAKSNPCWLEMKKVRNEVIQKRIKLNYKKQIVNDSDKLEARKALLKNLRKRFENKSKTFSTIIFPYEEEIKDNPQRYYISNKDDFANEQRFAKIFSFMNVKVSIKYSGNTIKLIGRR